uniref:Uncharacterized protein n=1 Tax=Mucochytrium quahogii TaxID=96639 RepID=A0A7S2WNX6_9STRA|mmetsp:Transcript_6130/g.10484  ORF Transcript_6130/g.10484 Transcript_6130/m.10484 type:complete len:179 (-) Transcript_6130:74-610(-)
MERSFLVLACLFASICSTFGYQHVEFVSSSYFTLCEVELFDINYRSIIPIGHYSTAMYHGTKASYAYDGDYSDNWERCAHLDNKGNASGNTVLRLDILGSDPDPAKVWVKSRRDANISHPELWERLTNVRVYISGQYIGNLTNNPVMLYKPVPQPHKAYPPTHNNGWACEECADDYDD